MVQEKEPKGITRRQFLKGITALGASALLSSCVVEEEPSPKQPTETPPPTEKVPPVQTPAKTEEPTAVPSPESTSTPEITRIVGLTITEEYLKNAFVGIGGEEMVEGEKEEISMIEFGQEYVSQSWGKEIDFKNLSEDPVASLKYLISLGAYQGQEGVYSPGKQGEEIIFPQLKDLSLPRLTLEKIPSEGEQKEQEYPERVSPQGLLLRPQTQMTVVGLLNQPKSAEEITVDKEVAAGELNFALVSFTDYLRSSEEGVPRHYLAVLPTHLPADQENQNTLTLKDLLEANGCSYDPQTNELTLTDSQTQEQTKVGLNRLEGEELTKDLRQETGLAFVDRMNDKLIKNPVVPYPDQMPAVWNLVKQEEEGKIGFLLQEQNEQGELVSFARAFYDEEKEAWRWKKVEPALEPGEILIGQDFIALPKEKILELLNLPENKDRMILPVFVGEDTVVSIHARPEGGNSVVISNLKERVLIKPSVGGIEQWINKGPRGMHLNYRLKNNGLILTIFRNEEVETTPITPDNEDKIELGTVLASGFKDIDVWPSAYDRGDNPYDISVLISPRPDSISNDCSAYILKYKERWVVLREK